MCCPGEVREDDHDHVGEKVRSRIDLGPDGILIGLSLPYTRKRSTDATNGRRDRTSIQLCQFEIESSTVAINVRRLVILSHGMSCV
jgi:hypothetical protein